MNITLTGHSTVGRRERRTRIYSYLAFLFAVACLLSLVWVLITSTGLSPAFETMRVSRSAAAVAALRREFSALYGAGIVCAQIGLLFGVRADKTLAGRFSIYATGIPLALIVLFKAVALLCSLMAGL